MNTFNNDKPFKPALCGDSGRGLITHVEITLSPKNPKPGSPNEYTITAKTRDQLKEDILGDYFQH